MGSLDFIPEALRKDRIRRAEEHAANLKAGMDPDEADAIYFGVSSKERWLQLCRDYEEAFRKKDK